MNPWPLNFFRGAYQTFRQLTSYQNFTICHLFYLKKVSKLSFVTIGEYIESKQMSIRSQIDPVIFKLLLKMQIFRATSSIFQIEEKMPILMTFELVLK